MQESGIATVGAREPELADRLQCATNELKARLKDEEGDAR
jgi:hypothetical protein